MALQHAYTFEAIGTLWSIETDRVLSEQDRAAIHQMIDDFDRTYSRFREDSLVTQAHRGEGVWSFPESIISLYDTYCVLERVTQGAVNPLVGSALEQWGYDADYSLRPTPTAATARVPALRDTIVREGTQLTYRQPALLDMGAVGKGYLVDAVARYVDKQYGQYVVEAGGDMRIRTNAPYVVGLEHPFVEGQAIGAVDLQDKSICASSPNRRSWGEGVHHILDARSGNPAHTDIIATWAIADTAMLADALSTALFFTDAASLRAAFGDFQYLIMYRDARVVHNMTSGQNSK